MFLFLLAHLFADSRHSVLKKISLWLTKSGKIQSEIFSIPFFPFLAKFFVKTEAAAIESATSFTLSIRYLSRPHLCHSSLPKKNREKHRLLRESSMVSFIRPISEGFQLHLVDKKLFS